MDFDALMKEILIKDINNINGYNSRICCNKEMELNHNIDKYICLNCGIIQDIKNNEELITKKVVLNINNNGYTSRYFGKNQETDEDKHKKVVDIIHQILYNSQITLKISNKTINDAADMMIMLRSNGANNKATIIKKDKFISTLLVCIKICGMKNNEMWEYDRELIKVFVMNNNGFSLGEKFVYDTLKKKGMPTSIPTRYDLYFIKYLNTAEIKYTDDLITKFVILLKRILYKNIAYSSNIKSKTVAIIYIYSQMKMLDIDKIKYIKSLQIEKATFDTARKNILRNINIIKIRYFI
jgi:hypothetical protein